VGVAKQKSTDKPKSQPSALLLLTLFFCGGFG